MNFDESQFKVFLGRIQILHWSDLGIYKGKWICNIFPPILISSEMHFWIYFIVINLKVSVFTINTNSTTSSVGWVIVSNHIVPRYFQIVACHQMNFRSWNKFLRDIGYKIGAWKCRPTIKKLSFTCVIISYLNSNDKS